MLWLILILALIVAFGAWRRTQAGDVLKSAPPDGIDNRTQLGRSLAELSEFLARHDQPDWAARVREIRSNLLFPATEEAALSRLSGVFGGMGSLNDVAYADAAQQQKIDELLDTVFRDMKLYHGGPADRRQWAELEHQHKGELPPRIKHSFRGSEPKA